MDTLKLICENEINHEDLEVVIEQKNINEKKKALVKGPYIVAEKKNANGRTYDKSVMEKAVNNYLKEYVSNQRSVGELNHPENTEINFENACHLVTELKQDGNVWLGNSNVLTGTPKGDLLLGLLENGVKVGMSTRGVGNVGDHNRVDEYKLVAIDVISNPSIGEFVDGILESKNYMIDEHGDIVEVYNKLENKLEELPIKIDEKKIHIIAVVREFIKSI